MKLQSSPFTVPIHPPFFAPSLSPSVSPSVLSLEAVGLWARSKEGFDGGTVVS